MEDEVARELLKLKRELATQITAHAFLLYALLAAADRNVLRRTREILESHAATGEYQGLAAASLRDALRIFSSCCESDGPIDPGKLFRLIPGGKND